MAVCLCKSLPMTGRGIGFHHSRHSCLVSTVLQCMPWHIIGTNSSSEHTASSKHALCCSACHTFGALLSAHVAEMDARLPSLSNGTRQQCTERPSRHCDRLQAAEDKTWQMNALDVSQTMRGLANLRLCSRQLVQALVHRAATILDIFSSQVCFTPCPYASTCSTAYSAFTGVMSVFLCKFSFPESTLDFGREQEGWALLVRLLSATFLSQ